VTRGAKEHARQPLHEYGNSSWSEDAELLELTAPDHYKTIDTVNGGVCVR